MNNVLVVFLFIFVAFIFLLQGALSEAFAASQGGALLQLQTNHPYYYRIAERP